MSEGEIRNLVMARRVERMAEGLATLFLAIRLGRPVHRNVPAIVSGTDKKKQERFEIRRIVPSGDLWDLERKYYR
jgi:hypothetical protein